jgi:hypothetical protein
MASNTRLSEALRVERRQVSAKTSEAPPFQASSVE